MPLRTRPCRLGFVVCRVFERSQKSEGGPSSSYCLAHLARSCLDALCRPLHVYTTILMPAKRQPNTPTRRAHLKLNAQPQVPRHTHSRGSAGARANDRRTARRVQRLFDGNGSEQMYSLITSFTTPNDFGQPAHAMTPTRPGERDRTRSMEPLLYAR